MATEIYGPLLPLQLDSRNIESIVKAIQTRINIESGGQITDFTPASPMAAMSEGQGFAQAELLYYLNSLPEAVTIQWLKTLGIQRKIGSRATVEISFFKVAGYSRPVTIPSGTRVYANGGQVFELLEQVSMTGSSATAVAQSLRWGSVYNVPAGSIGRIDRNFLGLDFITNNSEAVGGTDLETIDQMKLRAFGLFGRRNLTSILDFETEIASVAPEAALVKILPYESRYGDNSRGIFIVAGGADGSALSTATQSALLTSIRDRIPLDVKIYLTPVSVVPIEVVVNVLWDPRLTTTFTDTIASDIQSILLDLIYPDIIGLGVDLPVSSVLKEIINYEAVLEVPILDIKKMVLDPDVVGGTDAICGRFVGIEDEQSGTCEYAYDQIVTKNDTQALISPDTVSGFRLYRSIISLTSVVDSSTLTYTYENIYDIV